MRILILLICLLGLTSCKTKLLHIFKKEEKSKENVQINQENSVKTEKSGQKTEFQFAENDDVEIELESDKDSLGNSKSMSYSVTRSNGTQTVVVTGGRMKMRAKRSKTTQTSRKDTVYKEDTSNKAVINKQSERSNSEFKKEKDVEVKGFTFGVYFSLIFWILVVLALLFLAWRLKLFRQVPAIITKFKRLLKRI
ncbi:hypothetical protein [Capnocytophaga sp.]|uniref:hypothetical protein n=1 Tax=Capnocytophaga sp. TaxID=44737 RepID=UPI0026DAFE84|nr:hypothetical protein [Capnocytophaga sp.]MDO5106586.1 hypothetical protein [Capnocytophaga sp.]